MCPNSLHSKHLGCCDGGLGCHGPLSCCRRWLLHWLLYLLLVVSLAFCCDIANLRTFVTPLWFFFCTLPCYHVIICHLSYLFCRLWFSFLQSGSQFSWRTLDQLLHHNDLRNLLLRSYFFICSSPVFNISVSRTPSSA